MNSIFNRLLIFLALFDNLYIMCSILEGHRKHTENFDQVCALLSNLNSKKFGPPNQSEWKSQKKVSVNQGSFWDTRLRSYKLRQKLIKNQSYWYKVQGQKLDKLNKTIWRLWRSFKIKMWFSHDPTFWWGHLPSRRWSQASGERSGRSPKSRILWFFDQFWTISIQMGFLKLEVKSLM